MGVSARRARALILGFEFIWGIGLPFLQSTTTLPGYLSALGASGFLIGLVPAVFAGGIAIIQPLSIYLIRPGPRRFRSFLTAYRIGICFYLVMAASALLLPAGAVGARISTFFLCYLGYVFVAGAGDPHYMAIIVESVPEKERGWFFGLRQVWFGMGGLIGGALAAPALRSLPAPRNFGVSILAGALLLLLATAWFSRFEYVSHAEPQKRPRLAACLVDVWHLACRRRAFAYFLLVNILFVLAQAPFAFLSLYIKERLVEGDAILGRLSFLTMASSLVFAFALGRIGDRAGHRRTLLAGLCLYAVGVTAALAGSSAAGLLGAYFVAASCGPAWAVSGFNLGLQISKEPDPARVYAGMSLVAAPLRIAGPPAAGAAVDRWGHAPVLALAAALTLLGALILTCLPQETD